MGDRKEGNHESTGETLDTLRHRRLHRYYRTRVADRDRLRGRRHWTWGRCPDRRELCAQAVTSGHSAIVRYAGPLGASSEAISVNELTRQRIGCDKRRSITVVLRRASVKCGA